MSIITEPASIEGIDSENTPPCQMNIREAGTDNPYRPCGLPSALRILSVCGSCGGRDILFLCRRCHDQMIEQANSECSSCYKSRGITRYC